MNQIKLLLPIGILSLALVACGGSSKTKDTTPASDEVPADMSHEDDDSSLESEDESWSDDDVGEGTDIEDEDVGEDEDEGDFDLPEDDE